MLVLSIEASTPVCSVALCSSAGLVAEYTLHPKATHSERLLPAIDTILRDSERTLGDLDGVAVSVGPGSFTGIRVAVSTAKGLAIAAAKPVIPVSSLRGLACRFRHVRGLLCPVLDARKGEVYAALFDHSEGQIRARGPERVLPPQDLCAEIDEPTLFVGEGALRYRDLLKTCLGDKSRIISGSLNQPSAVSVGELALEKLRKGQTCEPDLLVPNYIRRSEAEIGFKDGS